MGFYRIIPPRITKPSLFLSLKMEQLSLTSLSHSPSSNLSPMAFFLVFSISFFLPVQLPLISNIKPFINILAYIYIFTYFKNIELI